MGKTELSEADRNVVDVLLNEIPMRARTNSYSVTTPLVTARSIEVWEKMLKKLELFEVPEPPEGLVDRTLKKIADSTATAEGHASGPSDANNIVH